MLIRMRGEKAVYCMSWIREDRHVKRSVRGERQVMGLKGEEYRMDERKEAGNETDKRRLTGYELDERRKAGYELDGIRDRKERDSP